MQGEPPRLRRGAAAPPRDIVPTALARRAETIAGPRKGKRVTLWQLEQVTLCLPEWVTKCARGSRRGTGRGALARGEGKARARAKAVGRGGRKKRPARAAPQRQRRGCHERGSPARLAR